MTSDKAITPGSVHLLNTFLYESYNLHICSHTQSESSFDAARGMRHGERGRSDARRLLPQSTFQMGIANSTEARVFIHLIHRIKTIFNKGWH
ncbi:hypothetical protein GWI33_011245 [Rhynchophorus ferrugineus]|uniref:Uncharacterized protein n=1 Tax=Rhynchophorus ferrugineus TaxID=354439 RepID=A0A834ID18_RHYFE|nr:hypothetical protein GWI33_011245 [Rhynchophorus ferrugineus]